MPSVSNQLPTGLPLSLLLVAVVTAAGAAGAWGGPTAGRGDRAPPPHASAEMLRALHYIQSLSQQAAPSPVAPGNHPPLLRGGAGPTEVGEEPEEEGAEQQWLQAVLETLQETQRQDGGGADTPKTRPQATSSALSSASRRRHRKYPPEQEQGGWGNSLKRTNENAQDEQYTPQKLATLQSVFEELQKISSSKSRSQNKRQEDEEEEEEEEGGDGDEDDDDEEEEEERMRKMTLEDWDPLEEQMEDEDEDEDDDDDDEDEEADRGELSREEDDEYDDLLVKRSSQSDGGVGRQGAGQPDDLSSLVDLYVLSVLEKTEQQEQRRAAQQEEEEQEEEEEEEQRRAAQQQEEQEEEEEEEQERGAATLSLLELVQLSGQLGLSPDQLLNLLRSSSNPLPQQAPARTPARTPTHLQAPARTPYKLSKPARTPTHLQVPAQTPFEVKLHAAPVPASRTHTHTGTRTHTPLGLQSSPHARPLEAPEDQILRLLGLPNAGPQRRPKTAPQLHPKTAPQHPKTAPQHPKTAPGLQDLLFSERSADDLEDDPEDDGAGPLERLLLEEGPEARGSPRQSAGAGGDAGASERTLEVRALTHALQDFLDQPVAVETPHSDPDDTTDTDADVTLQSILGLLRPEQQDSSETRRPS